MGDSAASGRPPSGRARRSAQLAAVVARSTGDRLVTELRRRRGDDEVETKFHERNAHRYAEHLGHAKGVLMKAGQLLSFASYRQAVPAEFEGIYQAALGRLRAEAPPMDAAVARTVIEDELDRPVDELFASFDDEPLASASIGQVHRATLADGTPVAVKIQYPGAADAIRADLANVELLATFLALGQPLFPSAGRVQFRAVAAELTERIGEELDYVIEADNLVFFGNAYRGHPFVRIPGVHRPLSTGKVLTMDLVEGRDWDQALAAPAERRDHWGEVIYRFVYGSLRRLHRINADPHPANYVFHDDGTVTFLDFGCVKRLPPETTSGMQHLVRALLDDDPDEAHRLLVALGYLHDGDDVDDEEFLHYLRALIPALTAPQPVTLTADYAADTNSAKFDRHGPGRQIDLPADLVAMERLDTGTQAVLGQLGATGAWRAILDELDGLGPPATPMGRAEHDFFHGERV